MLHQLVRAGGSTLGDLLQALEDYLPVLLGLVKDGKNVLLCQCQTWCRECFLRGAPFALYRESIATQSTVCLDQSRR